MPVLANPLTKGANSRAAIAAAANESSGEAGEGDKKKTLSGGSSASPGTSRSFTLFMKFGVGACILLGGSYFTLKQIVPVVNELMHPSQPGAAPSKDAPSTVQMLQQTRKVVAKNDANVDYLSSVINDVAPKPSTAIPLPASFSQVPELGKPKAAPRIAEWKIRESIEEIQINGVVGGQSPRIIINGMLIKPGEVVDHNLGLKFVKIDEAKKLILLANREDVLFGKRY